MMKRIMPLVVSLLLFSTIAFSRTTRWESIAPAKLQCRFAMPPNHKEVSGTGESVFGSGTEYLFSAEESGFKYEISIIELPQLELKGYTSGELRPFYLRFRDDIRSRYGNQFGYDVGTQSFFYSGWQLAFADHSEYVVQEIYLHEHRLYRLTVRFPLALKTDKAAGQTVLTFLGEFKLFPLLEKPNM